MLKNKTAVKINRGKNQFGKGKYYKNKRDENKVCIFKIMANELLKKFTHSCGNQQKSKKEQPCCFNNGYNEFNIIICFCVFQSMLNFYREFKKIESCILKISEIVFYVKKTFLILIFFRNHKIIIEIYILLT